MFSELNYLAIVISGVVYFGVGGLWYALAFNRPWMSALNFGPEVKKKAERDFPKSLASHFLSGFVASLVLANVTAAMGATTFFSGMTVGFWMWLGFALTVNVSSFMFERRPSAILLINSGFFLVAFAVVGGIVSVWR